MRNLFGYLEASKLYNAFLRHRVWAARAIPASHILYCFPLGTLALVWLFIPILIGTICAAGLIHESGDALSPSSRAMWIAGPAFIYHLVALPIVLRIYRDMFYGYFAGLFYVFGNTRMSETFVKETTGELAEWEAQYV